MDQVIDVKAPNPSFVQINPKQRGNPLLRHIRLVGWEYNSVIIPDYVMGSTCGIFISLRYHILHPKYVMTRMLELKNQYKLRLLLTLVDDNDNVKSLLDLNILCFQHNFTLILSWSNEEVAKYIETFKVYESKSNATSLIQERVDKDDFISTSTKVLTAIKPINKTDVITLLESFGNFHNLCHANLSKLTLCPGIGEKKVKNLYETLHTPFLKRSKVHESRSGQRNSFHSECIDSRLIEGKSDEDPIEKLLPEDINVIDVDMLGIITDAHGDMTGTISDSSGRKRKHYT
jgi:DNA excision repair protein ERCC-1